MRLTLFFLSSELSPAGGEDNPTAKPLLPCQGEVPQAEGSNLAHFFPGLNFNPSAPAGHLPLAGEEFKKVQVSNFPQYSSQKRRSSRNFL
jgi:hypothetical protein